MSVVSHSNKACWESCGSKTGNINGSSLGNCPPEPVPPRAEPSYFSRWRYLIPDQQSVQASDLWMDEMQENLGPPGMILQWVGLESTMWERSWNNRGSKIHA